MSLVTWSWIFLFGYMSLMVGIGVYAQRQIKHADDFATARGAYGPFFSCPSLCGIYCQRRDFLGQPGPVLRVGSIHFVDALSIPRRGLCWHF